MSRHIKRLAIIILLAIIVILISKSLLNLAVKNLSLDTEKKQLAKAAKLKQPSLTNDLYDVVSKSSVDANYPEHTSESSPATTHNISQSQ